MADGVSRVVLYASFTLSWRSIRSGLGSRLCKILRRSLENILIQLRSPYMRLRFDVSACCRATSRVKKFGIGTSLRARRFRSVAARDPRLVKVIAPHLLNRNTPAHSASGLCSTANFRTTNHPTQFNQIHLVSPPAPIKISPPSRASNHGSYVAQDPGDSNDEAFALPFRSIVPIPSDQSDVPPAVGSPITTPLDDDFAFSTWPSFSFERRTGFPDDDFEFTALPRPIAEAKTISKRARSASPHPSSEDDQPLSKIRKYTRKSTSPVNSGAK